MLEVLEVGGVATIQDAGRTGWRRFGVPLAGPMDRFAFEAANLLLGNQPEAAALELGAGDLVLRAQYDCVLAVAGLGYDLSVNDWGFPLWGSCFLRAGWTMRLARSGFGMWAYVAAAGGFDAPPVLGSRSTYLRGRFGGLDGRLLQPGDVLRGAASSHSMMEAAARTLPAASRPVYGPSPSLDVIPGPQADRFSPDDLGAFYSSEYRLGASSDRMGYRLDGPPLRGVRQPELTSEGMAVGAIQIAADGQPIIMLADSATAGGYPRIGCVTSACLPLLAQCTPGQDAVRFRRTTVESAQAQYRSLMNGLRRAIVDADDEL
jgi:antagonist of KipI